MWAKKCKHGFIIIDRTYRRVQEVGCLTCTGKEKFIKVTVIEKNWKKK